TSYDAGSSIQLRMEGHADIVKDRVCRQRAWRSLAAHSQELYASTNIPGTPLQDDDAGRNSDLASSFARFAWVSVKLEWLDWLDLSDNQRWQFKRRGDQWHGAMLFLELAHLVRHFRATKKQCTFPQHNHH